jgi:SAM-dependent methyltransferase
MNQEIDLLRFPKVNREFGSRTEEHRKIARRFDREFFDGDRNTGYGGYSYDGRWQPVATRLLMHYGLRPGARVLDIGCAKGFLVKDLRALGLEAFGIDISEYAISESVVPRYTIVADVLEMRDWRKDGWDLIVSINTLHNLGRDDLSNVLRWIGLNSYITLDAWNNEEERKRMEAWNLTARTMMSVEEWKSFFRKSGYSGDFYWFTP